MGTVRVSVVVAIACQSRPADLLSAIVHPRSSEPELNQRHDDNDDKQRNSDRRCVAHIEELEGIFIDIDHQTAAGVAWPTFGQNNDRIEYLKRSDHIDNQIEEDRLADQWQRYVPKVLYPTSPVELGCLVVIERNVLQAC